MKKRAMTLGLALFCAFLLCGCQRTTPAAPAQEAAPSRRRRKKRFCCWKNLRLWSPSRNQNQSRLRQGEELLLFGIRTPTLTDGEALYVKAEVLPPARSFPAS